MGRRNFSSPQGILEEYGGPPSLPAAASPTEDRGEGLLRLGLEALGAGDRGRARAGLREALPLLAGGPRERALEGLVEACRRDHPAEAAEAMRELVALGETAGRLAGLASLLQGAEAASLRERAAALHERQMVPLLEGVHRALALFAAPGRGGPEPLSLQTREQILACSRGEVGGDPLSEKIFGPIRDFCCSCGLTSGIERMLSVCPRCGVELISSRSRSLRCGHVDLAAPVLHPRWSRGRKSCVSGLLDLASVDLDRVIRGEAALIYLPPVKGDHFSCREVILRLVRCDQVDEEIERYSWNYGDLVRAIVGPRRVCWLLGELYPPGRAEALRLERDSATSKKAKESLERRIQALDAASLTEGGPGALALTALPVLPPALELPLGAGGEPSPAAALAPLYREIIEIDAGLREAYERWMPDAILSDLEGKLQIAVDALFDAFGGGPPGG